MSWKSRRRFEALRRIFLHERGAASRLGFTVGNTVRLLQGGDMFFSALIARIDAALECVAIETYIFADDGVGRQISAAMIQAAQRGVRVRIITDGVGTPRSPLFAAWAAAGIEQRVYNPYWFGRFGFSRTHRKLAVIDAAFAYCGGINMTDDHAQRGVRLAYPRWDFAVELSGPVVTDVRTAFELQWHRLHVGHMSVAQQLAEGGERLPDLFRRWRRSHRWLKARAMWAITEPSVAFVARDNVVNRHAIEKAYLAAIGRARREILLANPYFMPGRKLRRALVNAARRGVDVRILVGRNEFVALDSAVPFLYYALLGAGVRVAEYDKTNLHGKVAVIDSNWGTVGSSNLDALSLVLNNEANVVLVSCIDELKALRGAIMAAFAESREIDPVSYAARSAGERALNWLAYNAYRAAMKLLTIGSYD